MTHTLAFAKRPALPRKIARAVPREVAMNKLERAYGIDLGLLKMAGEIQDFWFEALKLRLADNTFYTPDFMVLNKDGELECHEVKGFWRDDARVKIKVAASLYPFRFVAVQRKRGAWSYEQI